jgi:hypothetical protein
MRVRAMLPAPQYRKASPILGMREKAWRAIYAA